MTTEEFKKLKPEYKNVEGDQLWNAMEDYMLRQQQGGEILKQIMPIWKTHTLRWVYYRRTHNLVVKTHEYTSDKRCSKCKSGVNARIYFMSTKEDGTQGHISYCSHCGEELKEEPNTNINHRLYKIEKKVRTLFWLMLDELHLIRSSPYSRYDMVGDERRYVESWIMNIEKGITTPKLKKRKWWEYVLIEKPFHTFVK